MKSLWTHKNRKGSRFLAYALTLCMIFTAFGFAAPTASYAAVENGSDLDSLVPASVVVLGSQTMTAGKGFLGNFTYLTASDINNLRTGATTTGALGLGNSWFDKTMYSSGENHGTPTWLYHCATGIDLQKAFAALGVNESGTSLSVKATDNYGSTYADAFAGNRYYYNQYGSPSALSVPPALILKRDKVESTSAPAIDSTVVLPTTDASTDGTPLFGYGQTSADEHTNCTWIQNTNKIVAGDENITAATGLSVVEGTNKQNISIWEMVRKGVYSTSYTYLKSGVTDPVTDTLKGIPLDTLLTSMGITLASNEQLSITSSDNWASDPIPYADLGKWFVAYEGNQNGTPLTNQTAIRLYGPSTLGNKCVVKNVTTLTVVDTNDGWKHPYKTGDDISNAVFYLGVETSSGGAVNYYYYTKQELAQYETTTDFAYNDHTIYKTATAKGAKLSDLLAKITGAAITDDMIVQYAEQDGYHADAATAITASSYKDKVSWLTSTSHDLNGGTIAPAQTVIAYGVHEEYQHPDTNNVNDPYENGVKVYKDADNNSGYLRAYRNTGSNTYTGNVGGANATVIKYLMGAVVSYSGSIFKGTNGYVQKTVSAANPTIAVAAPVTVTGLMPGMKFAAKAPAVVNSTLASGEAAYQLLDIVTGAALTATFEYSEAPYFYVKNNGTTTNYVYTEMVKNGVQTPTAGDYSSYDAAGNYGYSSPMFYRYNGMWLSSMLSGITGYNSVTVTATNGTTTNISAADISKYFIAYNNTQSKGSTNTSFGKRVTSTYDNPKLIIPAAGTIVTMAETTNSGIAIGSNVTTAVSSVEGVTVNYASSGGSGGGGGGGGGSATTTPTTSTVKTTSDVAGTVNAGKATSTVSAGDVSSLITKAKSEIKATGTDTVKSTIEINQTLSAAEKQGTTAATVQLPVSGVSSIVSDTDSNLKITTAVAQITFDQDALKNIAAGAAGTTVSISAEKLTSSDNAAAAKLISDGRPVFDFSVVSGDKKITTFNGDVSVSVPYTLAAGEKADGVVIYYIADDGTVSQVKGAAYDASTGLVTFTTNHFSNYAIGYDTTAAWVNPFTDVSSSAWYYSYVKNACAKDLFTGTSKTAFSPNAGMTRAMFVTVLGRMASVDASKYTTSKFSDVSSGSWYGGYVAWATEKGIVSGMGSGKFSPNASITREQMATILLKYYTAIGEGPTGTSTTKLTYSDAGQISSWAVEGVKFCTTKGLLNGYSNGSFGPAKTATRAEVAVITSKAAQ